MKNRRPGPKSQVSTWAPFWPDQGRKNDLSTRKMIPSLSTFSKKCDLRPKNVISRPKNDPFWPKMIPKNRLGTKNE
ncbi:uncharacterized protein METZ01_LOCUS241167 [marine metagenome]|uniref:Uncharacterized protein n=1 Tax=marine metagenome TaxID=408172 RepID=A0A382HNT7_9ZZZZ